MNKLVKMIPLALVLVVAAAPAAARDDARPGWRTQYSDQGQDRRSDRRDDRRSDRGDDRREDRRWDRRERHDDRRNYRQGYRDGRRYEHWDRPPRVVYRRPPVYRYGPPAWARGRDYRSYGYNNVYYVPYNDYYRYRLYQPNYGQRWYRDDRGNFLLVAAATGIITSVLLNHGY